MGNHVYIVFSSTPYRIGKIIRKFTGETYNHASIALDEGLTQMYGFARRYYHTPLYGGFVKESLSRYHVNGVATQVKVCRVDVTQAQYDALKARLESMYANKEHYLYNHLSIFSTPFKRLIPIRDAYICVEFITQVLSELGFSFDPKRYYSVGEVEKLLEAKAVYTGPIPQADTYDAEYFATRPVPPFTTLRAFSQLLSRLCTSRK